MLVLTWLISLMLFLLCGVHLYWMLGGKKGGLAAIPSDGSKPLFRPTKVATGVVAGTLAIMGWFVLELGNVAGSHLFSESLLFGGGWLLSVVFLLRAVGDFKWVGFSKRKKGTLFAKWDILLFSPLCLFIGICLMIITNS
jgi:hypothetical protein